MNLFFHLEKYIENEGFYLLPKEVLETLLENKLVERELNSWAYRITDLGRETLSSYYRIKGPEKTLRERRKENRL